ncbi:amino acid decarboxylase, partial [Intestinimonas massiliensis]|nr:amino acid decarboxylase [Intestinimonas massiliensis (ex Afouda et al. 2020)]
MDRGCHRSVYHSMALLDLQPVYLPRPWLTEEGVTEPISPQLVDNELKNHPDIK